MKNELFTFANIFSGIEIVIDFFFIQGSPQWIAIDFDKGVEIAELHVQFQGGFAGKDCWVEGRTHKESDWVKLEHFYPEDNNSLQVSFIEKWVFVQNVAFTHSKVIIYKQGNSSI